MAGKPQNRMDLRRQYDAAEPLDPMEDEAEDQVEDADDESERRPKKKPKATKAKVKAVKAVKAAARMRIVWTVLNDAFKPIATFEFAQKEAAEAKAAEMTARGKGTHFVQKTKEPMPDNAPGLGSAIPRPLAIEPVVAAITPGDDDEEGEEDDDTDADSDSDSEAEAEEDDDEE
ncbi:hypothetical protein EP7_003206 [Isosphaeraceae bacterium EP7]